MTVVVVAVGVSTVVHVDPSVLISTLYPVTDPEAALQFKVTWREPAIATSPDTEPAALPMTESTTALYEPRPRKVTAARRM